MALCIASGFAYWRASLEAIHAFTIKSLIFFRCVVDACR
jgi:hypothetical protein